MCPPVPGSFGADSGSDDVTEGWADGSHGVTIGVDPAWIDPLLGVSRGSLPGSAEQRRNWQASRMVEGLTGWVGICDPLRHRAGAGPGWPRQTVRGPDSPG